MSDRLDEAMRQAAEAAKRIREAAAIRNGGKPNGYDAKREEGSTLDGGGTPQSEIVCSETPSADAASQYDETGEKLSAFEKSLRGDVNRAMEGLEADVNAVAARVQNCYQAVKGDRLASSRDAEIVRKTAKELTAILDTMRPKQFVIRTSEGDTQLGVTEGRQHFMFPKLVQAAEVRDPFGNRKNILLKGPAGSGKSTAGKNLSKLLDLDFYYIGQTLMPHTLEGYVRQGDGVYQETAFTQAYRNGGVLMLEEMDGWSPQATLVINPALANGHMMLPNGEMIERHKDCIIIACANTWGTGATVEYVGRNKLDAAFLDRFGIRFDWVYDSELERAAAGNDDVVTAVQTARFNAQKAGLKIIISPRASIDCADMVRGGFTLMEAMTMNFLGSLDKNQRSTVLGGVDVEL